MVRGTLAEGKDEHLELLFSEYPKFLLAKSCRMKLLQRNQNLQWQKILLTLQLPGFAVFLVEYRECCFLQPKFSLPAELKSAFFLLAYLRLLQLGLAKNRLILIHPKLKRKIWRFQRMPTVR